MTFFKLYDVIYRLGSEDHQDKNQKCREQPGRRRNGLITTGYESKADINSYGIECTANKPVLIENKLKEPLLPEKINSL